MSENLLSVIYAQIILSYSVAIIHLLMFFNVFISPFWIFPSWHLLCITVYGGCILLYDKDKIDISHFKVYVNHLSSNSVDDYFFTFGPLIIGHLFIAGMGLFIELYRDSTFYPLYGAVGVVFGIIVPIYVKKPVYKDEKDMPKRDDDANTSIADEEEEEEEEEARMDTMRKRKKDKKKH